MADNLTRNLTNLLESARDMTLEALSMASSNLMQEQSDPKLAMSASEIFKLLDSRSDKDKLVALKSLITWISYGDHPDSEFLSYLPRVINNITSPNTTVKKFVYIYLLRFHHLSPDTALLSINAIQKATLDKDPVLRSLAIRTLSGIQIPAIIPILVISIKKSVSDQSPLVRASGLMAVVNCFKLELQFNGKSSPVITQLISFLKDLLLDGDNKVLNSAIVAFNEIQSQNYRLLHPYFHHILSKISELDSWSQVLLIDIFTNYCKLYCSKPTEDEFSDTSYFLKSIRPLVYSQSTDVLVALSKLYINLGTSETLLASKLHLSLLKFIKTSSPEVTHLLLQELFVISQVDPALLKPFINHFYLSAIELERISSTKLKILSNLIDHSNYKKSLRELKYYLKQSSSLGIQVESIRVISKTITKLDDSELNSNTLKWCFKQIDQASINGLLVDEILICIRHLMAQNPKIDTLLQLTSKLLFRSNNFNPSSRKYIISLLEESLNQDMLAVDEYIPDIIRVCISQDFYNYDPKAEKTRLEILNFTAKAWCKELSNWKTDNELLLQSDRSLFSQLLKQLIDNSSLLKLYSYCLYLCKFDESLDIRNEARKYFALLPSVDLNDLDNVDEEEFINKLVSNMDLSILILQAQKPHSVLDLNQESSLDQVLKFDLNLNPFLKAYNMTEDWTDKPLPNSVRVTDLKIKNHDAAVKSLSSKQYKTESSSRFNGYENHQIQQKPSSPLSNVNDSQKYKLQSLDEFFKSESEESEEEGEEGTEESEESDESEESEESDDSGESYEDSDEESDD